MSKSLSYCAQLAKSHDRDRFLSSLFLPADAREALFAAYALNAELEHVHHAVSEEMMGHIRYAWWEESLAAVMSGGAAREHPVLQALAEHQSLLPMERLKVLAERYRAGYPELPADRDAQLAAIAQAVMDRASPLARPGWEKARAVIARHRERFGARRNAWLDLKLLWAGLR